MQRKKKTQHHQLNTNSRQKHSVSAVTYSRNVFTTVDLAGPRNESMMRIQGLREEQITAINSFGMFVRIRSGDTQR